MGRTSTSAKINGVFPNLRFVMAGTTVVMATKLTKKDVVSILSMGHTVKYEIFVAVKFCGFSILNFLREEMCADICYMVK